MNSNSEIIIVVRRGDRKIEFKQTIEDEELPSFKSIANEVADLAVSVRKHLESADPTDSSIPPPPF